MIRGNKSHEKWQRLPVPFVVFKVILLIYRDQMPFHIHRVSYYMEIRWEHLKLQTGIMNWGHPLDIHAILYFLAGNLVRK